MHKAPLPRCLCEYLLLNYNAVVWLECPSCGLLVVVLKSEWWGPNSNNTAPNWASLAWKNDISFVACCMNLKLNSRPRNDRTQYKLLFINKEERDMRKKDELKMMKWSINQWEEHLLVIITLESTSKQKIWRLYIQECNEWVGIVQERLQESRFGKDSFWN